MEPKYRIPMWSQEADIWIIVTILALILFGSLFIALTFRGF